MQIGILSMILELLSGDTQAQLKNKVTGLALTITTTLSIKQQHLVNET